MSRDEILSKPMLKYTDVMALLGCGDSTAYQYIRAIREFTEKQGRPNPLQPKRVTSKAFMDYFELSC